MAVVTVEINDRPYQIACHDGQEEHVRRRAAEFNDRLRRLATSVGQVGDNMLLVMAGVLLTDELAEARGAGRETPGDEIDAALASAVEALAKRIDGIADRFRKA